MIAAYGHQAGDEYTKSDGYPRDAMYAAKRAGGNGLRFFIPLAMQA